MNLNMIHLNVTKATTTLNPSIISVITVLVFIVVSIYITIRLTQLKVPTILIIALSLNIIMISIYSSGCALKFYQEYKTGDIYQVYISEDEQFIRNPKEISKKDYDFILRTKEKLLLGDKPTKDEANKIKSIILKY